VVRIAGIDLPRAKRIEYALTKIYGIGIVSSKNILTKANIDTNIRTLDLTDENVSLIREILEAEYIVESDLRRKVSFKYKNAYQKLIVYVVNVIVYSFHYVVNVHEQMLEQDVVQKKTVAGKKK